MFVYIFSPNDMIIKLFFRKLYGRFKRYADKCRSFFDDAMFT